MREKERERERERERKRERERCFSGTGVSELASHNMSELPALPHRRMTLRQVTELCAPPPMMAECLTLRSPHPNVSCCPPTTRATRLLPSTTELRRQTKLRYDRRLRNSERSRKRTTRNTSEEGGLSDLVPCGTAR